MLSHHVLVAAALRKNAWWWLTRRLRPDGHRNILRPTADAEQFQLVTATRRRQHPCNNRPTTPDVLKIALQAGAISTNVKHRTRGGLTGSRSVGAIGRIPVETPMAPNSNARSRLGFDVDGQRVQAFIWVDNFTGVEDNVDDVI